MKTKLVFITVIILLLVGCSKNILDEPIYIEDTCDGRNSVLFSMSDGSGTAKINVEYYMPITDNEDGTFDYEVSDGYEVVVYENVEDVDIRCNE
ncbi:MAG: hypothetical protein K9L74_02520 [Candidatus Izimaplasma sp.]|nr:hypothetical protein [Candidatus Izimaplasma bacterium]